MEVMLPVCLCCRCRLALRCVAFSAYLLSAGCGLWNAAFTAVYAVRTIRRRLPERKLPHFKLHVAGRASVFLGCSACTTDENMRACNNVQIKQYLTWDMPHLIMPAYSFCRLMPSTSATVLCLQRPAVTEHADILEGASWAFITTASGGEAA